MLCGGRFGRFVNLRKVLLRSFSRESANVQRALLELRDIAVSPDQEEYQEAVKVYNPSYSGEHPAFVTFPRDVKDVQRCLSVAGDNGVRVAVKSGGHCFAGYSTIDSKGFMLSMKNFNRVTVDTEKGRAKVECGANWGDVYRAADKASYGAVGGCVPAVGVGGYIQGGGYSLMSRRYGGLACDNATEFTMVTADGSDVVVANKTKNRDLFWALCGGGGGNFGVLLDVTLKLYPHPKQIKWTRLSFNTPDGIREGLETVNAAMPKFPKEINLDMVIRSLGVTSELCLDAVYSSNNEEVAVEALKKLHSEEFKPQESFESYYDFSTTYSRRHGFVHYEQDPIYIKGSMITSISESLAKHLSETIFPENTLCLIEFVHMGGDIKNVPPSGTAFPWRSSEYSLYTYGKFHANDQRDCVFNFAKGIHDVVNESGCSTGSYINYMDRYLENWAHAYYGSNYARLCAIKEKWNPVGQGPLHFQQEIGSSYVPEDTKKMTQNVDME